MSPNYYWYTYLVIKKDNEVIMTKKINCYKGDLDYEEDAKKTYNEQVREQLELYKHIDRQEILYKDEEWNDEVGLEKREEYFEMLYDKFKIGTGSDITIMLVYKLVIKGKDKIFKKFKS